MDKIIRCLICEGQVSLTVIDGTELVNKAIEIHKTLKTASKILGGVLCCGAYLASCLKADKGAVSLTVKAAEGDGAVSVSADSALHVRGYADGACEKTLVGGSLTVVREDGFSVPFVGTCRIASDDISEILETYFGQSEQIPTAVCMNVSIGDDGKCLSAGGVVMQLLPEASEAQIDVAGEAFENYKSLGGPLLMGAEQVFEEYFAHLVYGEVIRLTPAYICNCSEEKIKGVLASVGREELLNIVDELGEVRVHCHYCNRDYVYDRKKIGETFGNG